ncbi:hypothetical protein A0256_17975 [Mucilaginibacter sp. PAMC 26640]|nr:hypothetical protein A0256_17975 [Mucilaginibacter sp. PAMC 26640]
MLAKKNNLKKLLIRQLSKIQFLNLKVFFVLLSNRCLILIKSGTILTGSYQALGQTWGSGRNPGDLGEVIRNLVPPTGSIVDKSAGYKTTLNKVG